MKKGNFSNFPMSADVRVGSRLCENTKAINRDRTSYSFKTVSCAHIASAFNFEIEIKNIILVALRTFEFSHGLGQKRKCRRFQVMSALPHKADINSRDRDVRFVPQAEVVVFAKRPIRLYGHPRIGYLWCNFWILQLPNRRSGHKWRKRGKTVRKPLRRKGARCAQTDAYGC